MSKELKPDNKFSKMRDAVKKLIPGSTSDKDKILEIIKDKLSTQSSELEDIKDDIPVTNGGLYALSKTLHALKDSSYDRYRKYLKIRQYWSNLWKIEGDDYLNNRLACIMGIVLDYGFVAIKYKNDKFIIYGLVEPKYDWDGTVVSGKGMKATPIAGTPAKFTEALKNETLNNKDTCFMKWGDLGLPLWFDWWYDIGIINWLQKQFVKNAPYNNKKTKWNINHNDSDIIQLEADAIYNTENRIVPIINTAIQGKKTVNAKGEETTSWGGKGNEFETLLDRDDVNEDTRQDYDWYWNTVFCWNGIRYNSDDRKSGNQESEVKNDNEWFDNIEDGYERELQTFIEQYNRVFKKSAKLVKRRKGDKEDVTNINKIKEPMSR